MAVAIGTETAGYELWVYDLSGKVPPLPLKRGGCSWDPVWTPDGRRIAFGYAPACYSDEDLYWIPADGSGEPERLLDRPNRQLPYSFSSDGGQLFFCEYAGKERDIWALDMQARQARPLFRSEYRKSHPAISPDGHWMAYQADATGEREIWIATYPDLKTKRPLSYKGGDQPWWSKDGKSLFYQAGQKMMAVAVDTERSNFGEPRPLFEQRDWIGPPFWPTYGVAPDGRFLLVLERAPSGESTTAQQINIVLNWFEELKRLVPTGK